MGTTTHYAFPYPVPADPANVPLDMQELADAIDTSLWSVQALAGAAAVGAKVSDLGSGFAGKVGQLRLMPVTWANGAVALPAATITVGDTSAFPTSGTLSTPNGDVAYTGKTATTFTGCTGGTGTMSTLSAIALKTGTPINTSFERVLLTYDTAMGKWVSPPISYQFPGWSNFVKTSAVYSEIQSAFAGSGGGNYGSPLIANWRHYDYAGLKPQVRFSCLYGLSTAWPSGVQFVPSFFGRDLSGTGSGAWTAFGADTAAASPASGLLTAYEVATTLWGNLPGGYTLKDWLYLGAQVKLSAGDLSAGHQRWDLRWVG